MWLKYASIPCSHPFTVHLCPAKQGAALISFRPAAGPQPSALSSSLAGPRCSELAGYHGCSRLARRTRPHTCSSGERPHTEQGRSYHSRVRHWLRPNTTVWESGTTPRLRCFELVLENARTFPARGRVCTCAGPTAPRFPGCNYKTWSLTGWWPLTSFQKWLTGLMANARHNSSSNPFSEFRWNTVLFSKAPDFFLIYFFNAVASVFIMLWFVLENSVLWQRIQFIWASGGELEESWKLL